MQPKLDYLIIYIPEQIVPLGKVISYASIIFSVIPFRLCSMCRAKFNES
jgi:hypothetical protein